MNDNGIERPGDQSPRLMVPSALPCGGPWWAHLRLRSAIGDRLYRLRALTWAMADLVRAMHVVEHDGNPMTVEVVRYRTGGADDDIPF